MQILNTKTSQIIQPRNVYSPTDPEEIELIIKSLSSNKRAGLTSIPISILKMFMKKLKTPLSNLVNLSFECGASLRKIS